ncbi:MAG: mandelate racemase/muconate lactonizing enzyme family protein [Cytophagales bacterium]|nr:mandelate racemase/muconate lactonizing enzyme family protein [Armatimonadota bacterium]
MDQKIDAIRTYLLRARLPEALGWSQGRVDSCETLLVQVVADDGSEGWGECAGVGAVNQAAVHEFFAPLLIGRDPARVDALWHTLWQASQPWGRRGVLPAALSGLDIALWDLRGKALGLPVSEMMGGRLRDRVPCYATGLYFRDRPETEIIPLLIQEAEGYVEAGYRAIKAHIGRNLSYDVALLRALRTALPDVWLLADAGHGYNLSEAQYIGRVMGEHGYYWFEDPISQERPEQLRQLADLTGLSIACGKSEQTLFGFQSLLATGGVSYAEPNVTYCGGLSEAIRIRAVAAALGVIITPHTGSSTTMIGLAAALHFLASTFRHPGRAEATISLLERNGLPNPLRDAIFSIPLEVDDGSAQVPTLPGLGVVLDMSEMRSFCISEQETRG